MAIRTVPLDPALNESRVVVFRQRLFVPSETFVREQARTLSRYSATFVARRPIEGAGPANISTRSLASAMSRRDDLVFGVTGRSRPLRAMLERIRPHLVHAHFGPDGLLVHHEAAAAGIPTMVTLHGRDVMVSRSALLRTGKPVATLYALNRRVLTTRLGLAICVSDEVRHSAVAAGLDGRRLLTHYIGVDVERYRPGGQERQATILHVARLVEKKGTAYLLQAFARSGLKGAATLRIIGDGPLRAQLESLSAELGIAGSVTFLGAQSAETVRAEMALAAVFALPSVTGSDGDREGLPIALLEAMSSGCAILATRHSGIPEAVDSDCGILVEERDVDAMSASLVSLFRDEGTARDLGHRARRRVEQKFNLTVQSRILEDIYDEVARATR